MKKRSATGDALAELFEQIFYLNSLLAITSNRLARKSGVTVVRAMVIETVLEAPHTVSQMARMREMSRQTVQRVVDGLVKKKLVVLEQNPHHARSMLVRLTDAGRKSFYENAENQVQWINGMGKGMQTAKVREALALLQKIRSRLN